MLVGQSNYNIMTVLRARSILVLNSVGTLTADGEDKFIEKAFSLVLHVKSVFSLACLNIMKSV